MQYDQCSESSENYEYNSQSEIIFDEAQEEIIIHPLKSGNNLHKNLDDENLNVCMSTSDQIDALTINMDQTYCNNIEDCQIDCDNIGPNEPISLLNATNKFDLEFMGITEKNSIIGCENKNIRKSSIKKKIEKCNNKAWIKKEHNYLKMISTMVKNCIEGENIKEKLDLQKRKISEKDINFTKRDFIIKATSKKKESEKKNKTFKENGIAKSPKNIDEKEKHTCRKRGVGEKEVWEKYTKEKLISYSNNLKKNVLDGKSIETGNGKGSKDKYYTFNDFNKKGTKKVKNERENLKAVNLQKRSSQHVVSMNHLDLEEQDVMRKNSEPHIPLAYL